MWPKQAAWGSDGLGWNSTSCSGSESLEQKLIIFARKIVGEEPVLNERR